MVKIVWTEISIADLKDIFDYISSDSNRYATIVVNQIYQRAQIISDNPSIGRIVREFNKKNIREIISQHNYRIIYKIQNSNQVDILRIYHSARLLKGKLL
jgi:toxin ParE1/3/4